MEISDFDSYCKTFVEVCKKHELKKGTGTQQLFRCYTDILLYMKIDQYEQQDRGLLELAKLIRLLEKGNGFEVTSAQGAKVAIQNPFVLANMLMNLHTELNQQSSGFYAFHGITGEKGKIGEGFSYKGIFFSEPEYFTEPYTDEELQRIIEFEEAHEEQKKAMKGRNRNGGNNPILGNFVVEFLACCPSLFGAFYCYTGPNGEPLLANFPPTKQYNIIGDLLEATGVLEQFKGKVWLESKWAIMNASERKKEVEGWEKSFEKAEQKSPLTKKGWYIDVLSDLYKDISSALALFKKNNPSMDLYAKHEELNW